MIDVKSKRCLSEGCIKVPSFNLPTESKGIYCSEHKLEGMIDVKSKRCLSEGCIKQPIFNIPTQSKGIYCSEHKLEGMINVQSKRCQESDCKEKSVYGYKDKRSQFCLSHKKVDMINLVLENKCSVFDCENEHEVEILSVKYCNNHCPDDYETNIKRLCKYCDIKENSNHICANCKKISCKKEWSIVRYLRKEINTPLIYNSSKMLQGCSVKRPDVYFELTKHCVIVEIDEHQHNSYLESCECARLSEIVGGIGGKSVIIIRFNPDTTRNKGKSLNLKVSDKVDLLVSNIKTELIKEYDTFCVKLIQLYFNDDYDIYSPIKEEDITLRVAI